MTRPYGKYACENCGGFNLQGTAWIDLNSGELTGDEPPTNQTWCADCECDVSVDWVDLEPVVMCRNSYLLVGDPLTPTPNDLIAQTGSILTGVEIPDGWQLLEFDEGVRRVARVVRRKYLDT